MTPPDKAQFWNDHVIAWQHSGLSQSAYCQQHGLKLSNFSYWRTRSNKKPSKLLPLNPTSTMSHDRVIVDIPGGVRIEMRAQTLPDLLPGILQHLRETR